METHLTGGTLHKVKLGADVPERVSEKSSEANISATRRDDPPVSLNHEKIAREQSQWQLQDVLIEAADLRNQLRAKHEKLRQANDEGCEIRHSVQAMDSQEWTAETVGKLGLYLSEVQRERIATAVNSALAKQGNFLWMREEYWKLKKLFDDQKRELAAEREKLRQANECITTRTGERDAERHRREQAEVHNCTLETAIDTLNQKLLFAQAAIGEGQGNH